MINKNPFLREMFPDKFLKKMSRFKQIGLELIFTLQIKLSHIPTSLM